MAPDRNKYRLRQPLTGAVHDVADFAVNLGRIVGSRIESLRELTEPAKG